MSGPSVPAGCSSFVELEAACSRCVKKHNVVSGVLKSAQAGSRN